MRYEIEIYVIKKLKLIVHKAFSRNISKKNNIKKQRNKAKPSLTSISVKRNLTFL